MIYFIIYIFNQLIILCHINLYKIIYNKYIFMAGSKGLSCSYLHLFPHQLVIRDTKSTHSTLTLVITQPRNEVGLDLTFI